MTRRQNPEAIDNSLSEYLFALRKDAPGKVWWHADFENRAPIYRQLRIDPQDEGAAYAVAPFRLAKIEERWLIVAAYPAPKVFAPAPDWLDIEAVIAWDPTSDRAHLLGDDGPTMFGALTDEANQLFASPRAFFQAWAIRRAKFEHQRQHTQAKAWTIAPTEGDDIPGALLIGQITKVQLSPSTMPEHIECHGIDPQELNRAIMRAARLPRATSASALRRAA